MKKIIIEIGTYYSYGIFVWCIHTADMAEHADMTEQLAILKNNPRRQDKLLSIARQNICYKKVFLDWNDYKCTNTKWETLNNIFGVYNSLVV